MKMIGIEKRIVNSGSHTRAVARDALALLDRVEVSPGWRYLDVGCGVGSAARSVAERGVLDVTGVDVDPAQIAAAEAGSPRPNLRFRTMSATSLAFADGEFDVVASSMMTHHIPKWELALEEMVRVLRPGGYFLYQDLLFPGWLAGAGRLLVSVMGFPSARKLDAFAERARLEAIYQSHGGMRRRTIYRKPD